VQTTIGAYLATRPIATLHDLSAYICRAEGVASYEALQLGPLLRHHTVLATFKPPLTVLVVPEVGLRRREGTTLCWPPSSPTGSHRTVMATSKPPFTVLKVPEVGWRGSEEEVTWGQRGEGRPSSLTVGRSSRAKHHSGRRAASCGATHAHSKHHPHIALSAPRHKYSPPPLLKRRSPSWMWWPRCKLPCECSR